LAMEAVALLSLCSACSAMHWSTKARPTTQSVFISASLCPTVCRFARVPLKALRSVVYLRWGGAVEIRIRGQGDGGEEEE